MRELQLVEQTNDYNCGAAALAMVLRLSDPGVVEREHLGRECSTSHAGRGIEPAQVGVLFEEVQRVLFMAGVPALPYLDIAVGIAAGAWIIKVWDRIRVADHGFLETHLGEGGTAMLVVPSLNTAGAQHWIVVAGRKVFDPSCGKKYGAYSEIPKLGGAILVGEFPRSTNPAASPRNCSGPGPSLSFGNLVRLERPFP
jgi:hypothetical protein